jgi:hypothetical protein
VSEDRPTDPRTGLPVGMVLDESFGDPETLFNSRDWLERALVAAHAKVTGKGCGMGQSDIDIELEGCRFNVSIRPLST